MSIQHQNHLTCALALQTMPCGMMAHGELSYTTYPIVAADAHSAVQYFRLQLRPSRRASRSECAAA